MTIWVILTSYLLPPALILLIIMTVPLPKQINVFVIKFTDFIFNVQFGTLSVYRSITMMSFLLLLMSGFNLMNGAPEKINRGELGYTSDLYAKASRWRKERNFWIAAITFVIYWMLLRFNAIKKELVEREAANEVTTEAIEPVHLRQD